MDNILKTIINVLKQAIKRMLTLIIYTIARLLAPEIIPFAVQNVCLCINLDQCNLRCIMCWQTTAREHNHKLYNKTNLPRKQLLQLLNMSAFEKTTITIVGGGEPFLYPYMDDLLIKGPTSKRRLVIMTNGTLLHRFPQLWETAKNAPLTLMFSIDAATPITYSLVRPPGSWDDLMNNINRFVKLRRSNPQLHISTSYVLMRQNLNELLDFLHLNKKWGSNYVHIHPAMHGNFPDEWRCDYTDPEYTRIIQLAIAYAQEHGIKVDRPEELLPTPARAITKVYNPDLPKPSPHFPWQTPRFDPRRGCTLHTKDMTLNHLGDVYLCDTAFRVYYSCGNVFRDGITNCWISAKWLSVRLAHHLNIQHLHPLCSNCLLGR